MDLRIVLLEVAIGRLHQTLRVDFSIVLIFAGLQLRAKLSHLLLVASLHDLVDADSPIRPQFEGGC